MRRFLIFVVVPGLLAAVKAQSAAPSQPAVTTELNVVVTDENEVPVSGARVVLRDPNGSRSCETDFAGRCHFEGLVGGPWQLHLEKESFYVVNVPLAQSTGNLDVSLHHQQEVRETVSVVESAPAIDPQETSSREQLSGLDIINIPYPNTRDYRYVLNYLPGVVLDQSAQPHVAGGETYESSLLLDEFNLTQPGTGQLLARVSTDAIRNVTVETSRMSAEYGKSPAGVLAIESGIGDDHFRFSATNFVPSVQYKQGWTLDKVDPRFTVSGPIRKGKMWFFDGIDGEYDNVVIPELPSGENRNHIWRLGNLAKIQANITHRDILTTSFLVNRIHDDHFGFSTLAPATTRPIDDENLYFTSVKEQHSLSSDSLFEAGFGYSRYGLSQKPVGNAPYVLSPEGAAGNYYLRARTVAQRAQGIANFYTSAQWHGRHDISTGIDLDRLAYDQSFSRTTIYSLREGQSFPPNATCPQNPSPFAVCSVFGNVPPSSTYNTEISLYGQDRWAIAPRLLLETGLRFDWDEAIRRPLLSPRLAGTYVLNSSGKTKLSAGVGLIYESSNLSLLATSLGGTRQDYFYDTGGALAASNLTKFSVNRDALTAPRFLNWSLAFEQELPARLFLKTEFMRRTGIHDFVYNASATVPNISNLVLQNTREPAFYSFRVDLRRTFHKRYIVTGSYSRSSSRANQVLDYSLDNLAFSPQVAGPFGWDTPNRFISWGWFPLIRGFDVGYSTEMRTGFPFAAVNERQQIVRPPGTYRFPTYVTVNLHLEKRFRALGANWALRGGFDNITNRQNPYTVNNNVNSPQFLTFSNFDRRAFTARIRFLGRK